MRTARARTSGANLFFVLLISAPPTQKLEPPANPVRFSFQLEHMPQFGMVLLDLRGATDGGRHMMPGHPAGRGALIVIARKARCVDRLKLNEVGVVPMETHALRKVAIITQIGRAHVWTPVTNEHPVRRSLIDKQKP